MNILSSRKFLDFTGLTLLFWHYTPGGAFIFRALNSSSGLDCRMSSWNTLTVSDCSILGGKVNFTGWNMWSTRLMIYCDRCSVVNSLLLHSQKKKYFKSSSHAPRAHQPLIEVEGWKTTPFFWGLEVFFSSARQTEHWRRLMYEPL